MRKEKKSLNKPIIIFLLLVSMVVNIVFASVPSLTDGSYVPNNDDNSDVSSSLTRDDVLSLMNDNFDKNGLSVNRAAKKSLELGVCDLDVYCCDSYQFRPLSGNVTKWTSSDEEIASVDENGKVRTFKAGTVTIEAADSSGNVDTCTINVLKVAYITIDDTPTKYTAKLLDILDQYGVKATFFMNAGTMKWEKELYKEIYERGHTFALHGYKHNTKYDDAEAFLENMEKCRQFIMETSGAPYVDNVIRFPTGSKGTKSYKSYLTYMHEHDYIAFDWTTEFHDYYYHTASGCLEYFKEFLDYNYANRSQDYAVVLFHPREWSVEALPEALEYIIENGYTFATITRDTAEYNFYARYLEN